MVRSQSVAHAVWKLCPHAGARAAGPPAMQIEHDGADAAADGLKHDSHMAGGSVSNGLLHSLYGLGSTGEHPGFRCVGIAGHTLPGGDTALLWWPYKLVTLIHAPPLARGAAANRNSLTVSLDR